MYLEHVSRSLSLFLLFQPSPPSLFEEEVVGAGAVSGRKGKFVVFWPPVSPCGVWPCPAGRGAGD